VILDKIENWENYAGLGVGLARGLEMLASGKLDALENGRHEFDGDALYASVQAYQPKAAQTGRWEAHRQYADIQYLARGCEAMGYCPAGKLSVIEPYDAGQDIVFLGGGVEAGAVLKVEMKMFAMFFPGEAHMPMLAYADFLQAGESPAVFGAVKKIVIKVKMP
jgi:YhcH/YjgK/YiaL family protein